MTADEFATARSRFDAVAAEIETRESAWRLAQPGPDASDAEIGAWREAGRGVQHESGYLRSVAPTPEIVDLWLSDCGWQAGLVNSIDEDLSAFWTAMVIRVLPLHRVLDLAKFELPPGTDWSAGDVATIRRRMAEAIVTYADLLVPR
ncbi:hypothetical protein BH09GEM1_BH09GEM1_07470 [soil metagenome]